MGIHFNKNNFLSRNNIIDCRCSITKKTIVGNTVFTEIESKQVKSIWRKNDGEITKIWERKNESLPQFLMLSNTAKVTMYVSDDLTNWVTLGTCYSTQYTSTTDDCRLYTDKYIGSMNGTYFASVKSTSLKGDTIGKLSKVADEWKWIPWAKVQSFAESSIAGIVSAENKQFIFINAKSNSEQSTNHFYFSVDSGNTWTKLINREITQILNLNGHFIFYGNGIFSVLKSENIENLTNESITNSHPGSGFPVNPLIIITDNKIMVYGSSTLFISNDNGMTWSTNSISSASSNWLKNEIVSTAYGHGMAFANMYKFDSRDNIKTYYLYISIDGVNWTLYPLLSAQINAFAGELLTKAKQRNLYYFDTIDKFVCTGIYNNTNPIIYVISIDSNDVLSYKMNSIHEENPIIIQNRYEGGKIR